MVKQIVLAFLAVMNMGAFAAYATTTSTRAASAKRPCSCGRCAAARWARCWA